MRPRGIEAAAIAAAGMALSGGALLLSGVGSGLPGAVAFLTAITLMPVTLGMAIAHFSRSSRHREYAPDSPGHRLLRRFRAISVNDLTRCTGCGNERAVSMTVLVCARCDRAPAVN